MQHRHPGDGLVGVGPQVGVREHRRLGRARCPAGVQQNRDVGTGRVGEARGDPMSTGHLLVPGAHAGGKSLRPESSPVLTGPLHREAQRGAQAHRHRRREVHAEDRATPERVAAGVRTAGAVSGEICDELNALLPYDDDLRPVRVQLGADLLGGRQRVVLGHDRADAQRPVEGHGVLRTVRHDEGHPVALVHPRGPQHLRRPLRGLQQLAVGQCCTQEVDGDPVRVEARRGRQQLTQGRVGNLDRRGNPRLVVRAQVVVVVLGGLLRWGAGVDSAVAHVYGIG